jgi:hypothetical protein
VKRDELFDLVRSSAEQMARQRIEFEEILRGAPAVAERIRKRWARAKPGNWPARERRRCLRKWLRLKRRSHELRLVERKERAS